jgi:hypothetical protein
MHARLAVVSLLLVAAAPTRAEEPPDIKGVWTLNKALSQDIAEKIKAAAGSATTSGGPSWTGATETWIPWSGGSSEGQRLEMREFLLATVPALQSVEIEQSPDEIKTIHGETGVRNFNLKRANSGSSALGGETVSRQARWQGGQLILESKGKESRLVELLTPVPTRNQLTYALRLEHKLLKAPLEVSLVYDRGIAH